LLAIARDSWRFRLARRHGRSLADLADNYDGLDIEAEPAALMAALAELLERTHERRPRYNPMRLVHPWVDLHPNRMLRSIYSGQSYAPEELIEEDARIEAARLALQELATSEGLSAAALEVATLEAARPYNCEHVVPQSSFAEKEPVRGDLHHLFTCESRCNSFRGNTPYFDFADFEEVVRDACGRREPDRFEPSAGKGAVARGTFYFLLRYPRVLGDEQRELQPDRLPVLLGWHQHEPVDGWERHRNAAIAELEGNRNR
jgi:endonuclease G, mitochondrial